MDRFWEKVDKSQECWVWTASKVHDGYGRFWSGGRVLLAHRVAYELEVGPIPDGLSLDHLCKNRACVRPDHLEPVTHTENIRRGEPANRTHCRKGHPYDESNTYRYKGRRYCRACNRETQRRRYAAKNGAS